MPAPKQILVFAEDPNVRHTKQLILEAIGFSVVAVGSVREIEYVSNKAVFDLAILGRTVSDPHKHQAASILRVKQKDVPILEICNVSPCIANPDYVLHSPNPEDLAELVRVILTGGERRIADVAD